jgi:hypothetical protein
MRRPSILDVVRAVKEVAPAYPAVRGWWYAPAIHGEIEVAVEGSPDEAIAAQLSERLWGTKVSIGPYDASRRLFRLLSV